MRSPFDVLDLFPVKLAPYVTKLGGVEPGADMLRSLHTQTHAQRFTMKLYLSPGLCLYYPQLNSFMYDTNGAELSNFLTCLCFRSEPFPVIFPYLAAPPFVFVSYSQGNNIKTSAGVRFSLVLEKTTHPKVNS